MTKPKHPSRKAGQPKPPVPNARKGVNNSRTAPKRIARAKQIAMAMEFRMQGHSFPDIATEMKIGTTTAFDLVMDGLKSITQEPAEQLLTQQIERMNALLTGVFADAKGGDDAKIATAMRVMERLDRLAGIAQPTQKLELTGADGGPIVTAEVTDEARAKALAAFVAKFTARKQGGGE